MTRSITWVVLKNIIYHTQTTLKTARFFNVV